MVLRWRPKRKWNIWIAKEKKRETRKGSQSPRFVEYRSLVPVAFMPNRRHAGPDTRGDMEFPLRPGQDGTLMLLLQPCRCCIFFHVRHHRGCINLCLVSGSRLASDCKSIMSVVHHAAYGAHSVGTGLGPVEASSCASQERRREGSHPRSPPCTPGGR